MTTKTTMPTPVPMDVHPFTDRGSREYQEDFFYTDPPARGGRPWLGVVSDGMGGHQGGDVASKAGIHALKLAFEEAIAGHHPTDTALSRAVLEGHKAVLRAAEQANAVGNMGATVVAFVVQGPTLYWCSAGDSRLYLFRGGQLSQLSRDFTLAEDMRQGVSNGDWRQEDIDNSPQRNALTSFMGTDDWRCDARHLTLQPGDTIVACSDGVYGTIDSDGIASACRSGSAQQIAENMQQRVLAVGKPNQDNSTAIVVRYAGAAAARPKVVSAPAPAVAGAAQRPTPRTGLALIGGGVLAAVGLAVGGYLWSSSLHPVKPPSDTQVVTPPSPPASQAVLPPPVNKPIDPWPARIQQLQDRYAHKETPPDQARALVDSHLAQLKDEKSDVDHSADVENLKKLRRKIDHDTVQQMREDLVGAEAVAKKNPAEAGEFLGRIILQEKEIPKISDATLRDEAAKLFQKAEKIKDRFKVSLPAVPRDAKDSSKDSAKEKKKIESAPNQPSGGPSSPDPKASSPSPVPAASPPQSKKEAPVVTAPAPEPQPAPGPTPSP